MDSFKIVQGLYIKIFFQGFLDRLGVPGLFHLDHAALSLRIRTDDLFDGILLLGLAVAVGDQDRGGRPSSVRWEGRGFSGERCRRSI